MWTPATRRQHSRDHLRYGSDLSDAEWDILAPFMPSPARTGRPRRWTMREIMNAIFYVLRGGISWRLLPKDFPPMTTVYGWFLRFRREGLFQAINHHLVIADRERTGRQASVSSNSSTPLPVSDANVATLRFAHRTATERPRCPNLSRHARRMPLLSGLF